MTAVSRVLVCAVATTFVACQSGTKNEAANPPVRLNPVWSTVDGLLAPSSLSALEGSDVLSSIPIGGPLRLRAHFDAEIAPSQLKVFGAHKLRIEVAGEVLTADADGWQKLAIDPGVRRAEVEVVLTPEDSTAALGELELWGTGRPAAPRHPELIVDAAAEQFENLVRVSPASDAAKLEVGNDARCASFSFPFTRAPGLVRRAYLTYRGPSLKSPVVLRRSLNGWPASGGFWMERVRPRAGSSTSSIRASSPRRTSSRSVYRTKATADVQLDSVAIVAELDDGTNLLDRDAQVSAGGAWDERRDTSAAIEDQAWSFARPVSVDRLDVVSGGPRAVLSSVQAEHHAQWTKLASNIVVDEGASLAVALDGAVGPAEAVALHVEDAGRADLPKPHLAEVRFAGSPVGPRLPKIVVTYPTAGEHFGSLAYVAGFVDGESLSDRVEVTINGEPVAGNGFARLLQRTGPT